MEFGLKSVDQRWRPLVVIGGAILFVMIFFAMCCTVVDSGEVMSEGNESCRFFAGRVSSTSTAMTMTTNTPGARWISETHRVPSDGA